jgi:O-antigen/teichoic acid export membrane protein
LIAREVRRPKARAAWTILDQTLSSASNFALAVIVARHVGTSEYGVFAIGFTIYALTLGVSRAFATDPLVVRFSHKSVNDQREEAGTAAGTAILFGVVLGGLLVAAAAFLAGSPLRSSLLAFGLGMPFLLWQDSYRYQFVASRRPQLAALNDLVWLLALSALFAIAVHADASTAAPYVAVWSAAAGCAAVVGMVFARTWPRGRGAMHWLRLHADLNVRFAVESLMISGAPQVVLLVVAAVSGYSEAGGLRGAIVLLGPVILLATGAAIATVPEGVRLKDRNLARLRPVVCLVAALLSVVVVVWSAAVSGLPDRAGEALLGPTWHLAQEITFPLGLAVAGTAASVGLAAGLRSLAAARRSLRATVPAVLLLVAGGVAGGVWAGGVGAARGMVIPAWIGAGLYLRQFVHAVRDEDSTRLARDDIDRRGNGYLSAPQG